MVASESLYLAADTHMVVVSDFDATITLEDTGHVILNNFAVGDWVEVNDRWRRLEVTTEERARQQFGLVHVSPEIVADLVARIPIDPQFGAFVEFCRTRRMGLRVVSDGYDFIIERIFAANGIRGVPFFSNRMAFQGYDIVLDFANTGEFCELCGNCKLTEIRSIRARQPEARIVYIGDGFSDRCGAQEADLVFAKLHLAHYCEQNGIPFIRFQHFAEIIEYFSRGAGHLRWKEPLPVEVINRRAAPPRSVAFLSEAANTTTS